jgi:hypothetical protein
MSLRGSGEGTGGAHRVGLTVAGTIASRYDLLRETGDECMYLLLAHQSYIAEAQGLLALDEGCQVCSLSFSLGEHEIATTSVVQIGVEFLLKRAPALNRFNRQRGFCRMSSLATNSTRTGPGSSRSNGNLSLLQNKHLPSLPC